jgi:hypothetical protein
MTHLEITSTVSSFLTEKTLEGFHPVRGMVLARHLPVEELTPSDLDLLAYPASQTKEWHPRPALVDMEPVLRMATGHPHAVYGESLVSPKLIHWTVGEAQLLVSFGSVLAPQRALALNVVTLLGNHEARKLMQQVAVELRSMLPHNGSQVAATMPTGYGTDTARLAYSRAGLFKANCTMLLDANSEPSAERLQDYLELMHSVELNIDTPQEKLGWTESMTKPGQIILWLGEGLPCFRYEANEPISWEIKTVIDAQSVARVQELMSLMFGCEFKL